MYVGVIKNKDIFANPAAIISMKGVKGFFKILRRAFSRKKYHFINALEETQKIFIGKRK